MKFLKKLIFRSPRNSARSCSHSEIGVTVDSVSDCAYVIPWPEIVK